ncbi:MAG: hypothetical protein Q4G02_04210 [bacterium]|nr:hypothetical protein [bacterium]
MKSKRDNVSVAIIVLAYLLLWLSFFFFLLNITNPWIWLLEIISIFVLSFFSFKINKAITTIFMICTVILLVMGVLNNKENFCRNYGVPGSQINQMINITSWTESEKSRYSLAAVDYQPDQALMIGRGFKATLDCESNFKIWSMLKEIFTKNWFMRL